jgi:hypothetical protein
MPQIPFYGPQPLLIVFIEPLIYLAMVVNGLQQCLDLVMKVSFLDLKLKPLLGKLMSVISQFLMLETKACEVFIISLPEAKF